MHRTRPSPGVPYALPERVQPPDNRSDSPVYEGTVKPCRGGANPSVGLPGSGGRHRGQLPGLLPIVMLQILRLKCAPLHMINMSMRENNEARFEPASHYDPGVCLRVPRTWVRSHCMTSIFCYGGVCTLTPPPYPLQDAFYDSCLISGYILYLMLDEQWHQV